ncbi:MAG: DUF3343 domain-containing protein [Clostridia bacterium]|nr:DUF3343 domain-containing protein [Clostridia bacterium]
MREANGLCRAAIGSVTHATQAQNVLARAAIRSRVIKVSSGQRNGCVYGIEIPCSQKRNAEEILSHARIAVHGWSAE